MMRILWGLWAIAAFAMFAGAAVLTTAVAPGQARRRRIARACARAIFRVTGTAIVVNGLERLPSGPCIVAANHASYVDGVLMQAILPDRFAFVVKKEVLAVPLAGLLLRRLGTEFVDRFNARDGTADTARLVRNARAGSALAAFPEGTFHPEQGLRRFRMGLFYAATRAGLPIVPVAICGTRAMLPAGRWLPRQAILEVWVGDPIVPDGRGRQSAYALSDAVRSVIIANCGEACAAGCD